VSISLRDIGEQSLEFVDELELQPESLDPGEVAGPISVRLQGKVAPVGEGFTVSGVVSTRGDLLCSRCLSPVPWQGEEDFFVELRYPPEGSDEEIELAEADLEVVFIDGDTLDLVDLAVEQVMLSLPMRVLCAPDCAGLCPTCGANRNLDPECGCQPETDPRWEALRALQVKPS
jgi:uncharacterized protein